LVCEPNGYFVAFAQGAHVARPRQSTVRLAGGLATQRRWGNAAPPAWRMPPVGLLAAWAARARLRDFVGALERLGLEPSPHRQGRRARHAHQGTSTLGSLSLVMNSFCGCAQPARRTLPPARRRQPGHAFAPQRSGDASLQSRLSGRSRRTCLFPSASRRFARTRKHQLRLHTPLPHTAACRARDAAWSDAVAALVRWAARDLRSLRRHEFRHGAIPRCSNRVFASATRRPPSQVGNHSLHALSKAAWARASAQNVDSAFGRHVHSARKFDGQRKPARCFVAFHDCSPPLPFDLAAVTNGGIDR